MHGDFLRGLAADADLIGTRRQAGQHITAVGQDGGAVGIAVGQVDGRDDDAARGGRRTGDLAFDRGRAQLGVGRARQGEDNGGGERVAVKAACGSVHGRLLVGKGL